MGVCPLGVAPRRWTPRVGPTRRKSVEVRGSSFLAADGQRVGHTPQSISPSVTSTTTSPLPFPQPQHSNDQPRPNPLHLLSNYHPLSTTPNSRTRLQPTGCPLLEPV
jgi:hypothetical protein